MLLRARWILPVSHAPIADGAVVVRGARIAEVGPAASVLARHPQEAVTDLGDAAIVPGLINAHSHLELGLLRDLLTGLPFFPWLRRVVEIQRDAFRPGDHELGCLAGAAESIRAGITCIVDCSATGAPLDALIQSGLRGVVHQEVFAPDRSWLAPALASLDPRLDALLARAADPEAGGRIAVGVSPHSPYMACPELLDAAARIASDRRLPLSIHLAESREEDALIRDGAGPIAEHFRSRGFAVTARGRSPVEHVARHGLLSLPVQAQLVHLSRASAADLDLVASAVRGGARLGLAACPRSNAALGNGVPDLAGWTRRGIPWAFGTDGACSTPSLDLFPELESDSNSGGLRRVTLEAARSLGMERDVGSLEPGKFADLCALPLRGDDLAADLAAPVLLTMVAGRILWDGRAITTLDETAIGQAFRARHAELLARD